MHLTRNYPVSLKQVVLAENAISLSTIKNITACLEDNDSSGDSDSAETTTDNDTSLSDTVHLEKNGARLHNSRARRSETSSDSYASDTESETKTDDSSCSSVEELQPVERVVSGHQKGCIRY